MSRIFSVQSRKIAAEQFGMHICGMTDHLSPPLTPYHRLGCGSIRLWDCGVNWRSIETQKSVFNWVRMDRLISILRDAKVTRIMYVLGQAPDWATDPFGGAGTYNPFPPNDSDLEDFIHALLSRYPEINEIEAWNEPNYSTYYNGEIDRLAALTVVASEKCRQVRPNIHFVGACPDSYADRGMYLFKYLQALSAIAGGKESIDAVSFHSYVQPREPEHMLFLSRVINGISQSCGFSGLPVYSTEFGWGAYNENGVQYGMLERPMSEALAAAYITRSFLVSLSVIDRQYFYALDKSFSSLRLIDYMDKTIVTPAGASLEYVSSLLSGGVITQLRQNGHKFKVTFFQKTGARVDAIWCADGNSVDVDFAKYDYVTDTRGAGYSGLVGNSPIFCFKI